jgi:hypothetical protein
MPQDSPDQLAPARFSMAVALGSRRRRMLPVAALAAALATLAGCGPDIGPGSEGTATSGPVAKSSAASAVISSAQATGSKPASAAAAAAPAIAAAAANACPQPEQPKCPSAPAAQTLAVCCCCTHNHGHHHHVRRERVRHEAGRSEESVRTIYRRSEDFGPGPPCPGPCPGAGRRDWSFTGIDARGYLVWPGKVEY